MWLPDVEYLKLLVNGLVIGLVAWFGAGQFGEELTRTKTIAALLLLGPAFAGFGALYLWLWGKANILSIVLLLELTPGTGFIDMGYTMLVLATIGVVKRLFLSQPDA